MDAFQFTRLRSLDSENIRYNGAQENADLLYPLLTLITLINADGIPLTKNV